MLSIVFWSIFSVVMCSSKWLDSSVNFTVILQKGVVSDIFTMFNTKKLSEKKFFYKLKEYYSLRLNIFSDFNIQHDQQQFVLVKNNYFRFSLTHWKWLLFIKIYLFRIKIISDKFTFTMLINLNFVIFNELFQTFWISKMLGVFQTIIVTKLSFQIE